MLKLLLDEHISPDVAIGLRRREERLFVYPINEWRSGMFLGVPDDIVLKAAREEGLTFVTYDRKTIPPLLKVWAEESRNHGGIIFVDDRTISPANVGGLVRALYSLWKVEGRSYWTNRIYMLQR